MISSPSESSSVSESPLPVLPSASPGTVDSGLESASEPESDCLYEDELEVDRVSQSKSKSGVVDGVDRCDR